MRESLVIAVDGPSGAGKSTAGRALAERLGYTFVDTGAMYRAVAWKALRAGLSLDAGEALGTLAQTMDLELEGSRPRVFVDGVEITEEIRTREMSQAASRVSALSPVRRALVARQRALGQAGGVVMDGRDIASVVFPDADVKFYVDASPYVRAVRRQKELAAAGRQAAVASIEREIRERDQADSTRADSPLVRVPEAFYLDTTDLTAEAVLAQMLTLVAERRSARPQGERRAGA
jgi:CMP/dCMP kinase